MDKSIKIILGLLIMLAGVYTYIQWPSNLVALWTIIRGAFGLFIIIIGLMFVLIGFTE